ncbi:hypothetical protein [Streptomyces venezuelae]|uniref:hypothetical protein n=1 Tax=Streptomyces venezuelae TaxID=54571 RepID=UPI0012390CCD|nr:hypothetical protein [Streptomyces venezuelae]QES08309.1 hypothetical protein DEJ44_23620 [Streptomyces venezuelae]
MGDEAPRTTRDPRAEHRCPACGQRRATTATRHKVLGAWVPEWELQPCRNPDCPLHEDAVTDAAAGTDTRAIAEAAGSEAPITEAASTQVTGTNDEIGRSPAAG